MKRFDRFYSWYVLLFVIMLGTLYGAFVVLFPAIPSHVTLGTAFKGTGFNYFGEVYREALLEQKLDLRLRETSGTVENLNLLQNASSGVQAGFVLGGVTGTKKITGLYSLGTLYNVGLWIFYVSPTPIENLTDFRGKRIALGPKGSGIRVSGEKIFASSGVSSENAEIVDLGGDAAFDALRNGTIDAVWTTLPADSPIVRRVLEIPNVQIFGFKNADAYTRLFPEFAKIDLPRGVLDLVKDRPKQDTSILAARVRVLVREDIHPQFVNGLLLTMTQVHGRAGVAQRSGEFPTPADPEYPILPTALDFYKNGPTILHRYLPLWIVPHVQRITLLIAAIVPLIFLIISGEPQVYRWIIREKFRPYYKRMRRIELSMRSAKALDDITKLQSDLEELEVRSSGVRIPNRYADSFFSFKIHLNLLRLKLAAARTELAKAVLPKVT